MTKVKSGNNLSTHLWAEFKEGSKSALIEIYKLAYDELFNYGMRISHNEELTRDCIHDLFVRIWSGQSQIANARNPKPYMFRILRNIVVDALKQNNAFIEASDTELYDPIFSGEDLIINAEISQERSQKLKMAIEQLSNRQKEIIYLKFYNGLSYEEISAVTQLKYQSVRNLFSVALKELRKKILLGLFLIWA